MKTLLCCLLLVAPAFAKAADSVYLNNGKILRGTITEESGETITLEGEAEWQEIKRADIKKIDRNAVQPQAPQQAAPAYPQQQGNQQQPIYYGQQTNAAPFSPRESGGLGALKLGYDSASKLSFGGDSSAPDADVKSGATVGLELLRGYSVFGVGFGLEAMLPRALKADKKSTFMFVSVPIILELSNYTGYRAGKFVPYFRVQAGLGAFLPNKRFLGGADNDVLAIMGGVGVGLRKKGGLVLALDMNSHLSSVSAGDYYVADISYSVTRLSLGYSF